MGEYEELYDTISNILSSIKEGQTRHDYALIPYEAYESWKRMNTFKTESEHYECDKDGKNRRRCLVVEFEEDDNRWVVYLGDSKHPEFGDGWYYIQNIMLNGKEFSAPRLTVDEYEMLTFKKDRE